MMDSPPAPQLPVTELWSPEEDVEDNSQPHAPSSNHPLQVSTVAVARPPMIDLGVVESHAAAESAVRRDLNPSDVIEMNRKEGTARGNSRLGFRSIISSSNVRVQVGDNYYVHHNDFSKNVSFFGPIVPDNSSPDVVADVIVRRRAKKDLQTRRLLHRMENSRCNVPYVMVKNDEIKNKLLQIAKTFQLIDRFFAEYFQEAERFGKNRVQELLEEAREEIAGRQNQRTNQDSNSDSIVLGDLGHFCEDVSRTWCQPRGRRREFTITNGSGEKILYYLQDAFEVPYWKFILDLFLEWRANSHSLAGDVVLLFLNRVKLDVLNMKRRLLEDLGNLSGDNEEDIDPILRGIDDRIGILKNVWDSKTSSLDELLASTMLKLSDQTQPAKVQEHFSQVQEELSSPNETVVLITLVLLFLIGAIIPGYIAFAISMKSSDTGSTEDADYWYLVQSSIMSVLGNLVMVVSLRKKSWFSPAYSVMWALFALGIVLAAVSIIIYPLMNTGWSSVVSFLGSIISASSVLVMTQATAKEMHQGKVKTA